MGGKKNLKMKAARVEAGLSQSQLAEEVGVTRQTIGLIEAGGYNPRSICAWRFARGWTRRSTSCSGRRRSRVAW